MNDTADNASYSSGHSSGHSSGDNSGNNPLEALFSRIRATLGDLAPEPLFDRLRPVLDGFFDQFQLVPRREYDTHLAALSRLEETVSHLEQRISELERGH